MHCQYANTGKCTRMVPIRKETFLVKVNHKISQFPSSSSSISLIWDYSDHCTCSFIHYIKSGTEEQDKLNLVAQHET